MRLLRLNLQNFLSFGDEIQRIDLTQRGLLAVFGHNKDSHGADSNGAGKSALLEAIVWVLYGQTMRGYSGDQIVNRKVGRNCVVVLTIDDGGIEYKVVRTRKAPAKRPNDLQLWINGNDASQGTVTDTQALVQTVVGMDFVTFTQSVMMSHGVRPFSSLTDKEQKSVLEDILQIGELARAQDLTRRRLASRRQDLASTNGKLATLQERLQDASITRKRLAEQRDQHASRIRERRMALMAKKAEVEGKIQEIYEATGLDQLLTLQEDLQERETVHIAAQAEIAQQKLRCSQKYGEKRTELAQQVGMVQGKLAQLQQECSSMDQLAGKSCPTCHQVLTPEHAEDYIAAWAAEADKLVFELNKYEKKKQKSQNLETAKIQKLSSEVLTLAERQSDIQKQRLLTEERIHKRRASLQLICQLEQQSWNQQLEIDSLNDTENPYHQLILDADAEVVELEKSERQLNYKLKALDVEVRHLHYWDEGFGNRGLKSYMLDTVVPTLTERAQEYADVLSGGELKIKFSTTTQLKNGDMREQFSVQVTNQQGADVYRGNSDGEKGRIDLAVGWALGDLAAMRARKPICFKALDEPFEHLDSTGEDAVLKLLHSVLPQYETIVCVTHSSHLRNQFPAELIISKENGTSVIETV